MLERAARGRIVVAGIPQGFIQACLPTEGGFMHQDILGRWLGSTFFFLLRLLNGDKVSKDDGK